MKTTPPFPSNAALTFFASAVLLLASCGKQETAPEATRTEAPSAEPLAGTSAEKNSFKEVTARLDPGGEFFLYWGTEQIVNGLSAKITGVRQFVMNLAAIPETDRANVNKAFDMAARLIKKSGIETITGIGVSSIAREPGVYRSKFVAHHYPGQNSGLLWSLFGKSPHALTGLDLLPATTAFASFTDFDFGQLWTALAEEISQAGFPAAQTWLERLPIEFEEQTKLKFDQVLASLGGEYGIVITLNESKQIPIPLGTEALQVPEPGVLIAIKVKNDLIFDHVEKLIAANDQIATQVIKSDKDGLRMRTVPIPLPLPILMRPSVGRAGDYLFLASSDALIETAAAVMRGERPGWKQSDEYRKLAQGLPEQGNQFIFLSQRFGQTAALIQQQAFRMTPQADAAQMQSLQKLFGGEPAQTLTIASNTEEGWLGAGNGNQAVGQWLLGPTLIAPAAIVAGMALPALAKAKQTAQRASIMANLRMIQDAKQKWAMQNKKPDGTPVTESDLATFLRDGKVKSIQGERYDLNSVGRSPAATLPDGSSIALP